MINNTMIKKATDESALIKRIGIPRALLFYRYGRLWRTFFEELGIEVVVSSKTTRATLEAGESLSVDECCLASKVYLGHVSELIGKVDAIFIPGFASGSPKAGFCTKFQSLPDLVSATCRDIQTSKVSAVRIISFQVEDVTDDKALARAYTELGVTLGASHVEAKRAYKAALRAQRGADRKLQDAQDEIIRLVRKYRSNNESDAKGANVYDEGEGQAMLPILYVAHPYIAHDPYLSGDLIAAIEDAGGVVIFADIGEKDRLFKKSFEFSETLPWIVNRELAGSVLELMDDVSGIVVVSAFPCGPDSMFVDALMRSFKDIPILHLTIDAQSANAGVLTRVESFMDILFYKRKGGYLDE